MKKIITLVVLILLILMANAFLSTEPKCERTLKNQEALIEIYEKLRPGEPATPSRQQYYSFEFIKRIDEDEFEIDCNRCLVVDANKWAAIIPKSFKTQYVSLGYYLVKLQNSKRGSYQIIRNAFVEIKSYEGKKDYIDQSPKTKEEIHKGLIELNNKLTKAIY